MSEREALPGEGTASALSPAAEAEWARLERTLQMASGFWLGFVFSASKAAVEVLRERTRRLLEAEGRAMRVVRPEAPAGMLEVIPAVLDEASREVACVWVEAAVGSTPGSVSHDLWVEGWDHVVLRMNERRESIRRHLGGGLLLAAPEWMKPRVQEGASGLYLVRALVILLDEEAAGAGAEAGEEREVGAGIGARGAQDGVDEGGAGAASDPEFAMAEARRLAGFGERGRPGRAAALLRAVEGFVVAERTRDAVRAAREVEEMLRCAAIEGGPDHAAALAALARAEEANREVGAALGHWRQAIEARGAQADGEVLGWYDRAARIAAGRGELGAAREMWEQALVLARRLGGGEGAALEARSALLESLRAVAEVRRAAGEARGAREAEEEARALEGEPGGEAGAAHEGLYVASPLPPLTERLPPGREGAEEFARLMRVLLKGYADRNGFEIDVAGSGVLDAIAPCVAILPRSSRTACPRRTRSS
jgi:tetratricopeptide (TPR) repeat protein